MTVTMPKVSVIMPAYNAERYVAESIESILNQTLSDFEFIILDDCSDDGTSKIISKYAKKDQRIKPVKNKKRLNIAGSLNKGIKLSKGEYLARMDADDISLPHRLQTQYDFLKSNEHIAVVGANIIIINSEGVEIGMRPYPRHNKDLKKLLFRYSAFAHPVVMYRKSAVKKFGGYNNDFSPTEDLDLWFRLGTKYDFHSIQEPLLKYRFFEASSSNSSLRELELLVLRIRLNAILKHGYVPGVYDVFYNAMQYFSLWFMPARVRIKLYNSLRNKGVI